MNAILIPAYKPDMKLVELCSQLLTHEGLKIVVVDDGSGEEYKPVFDALDKRVHLISYPVNKGKGGALKTGIRYIYSELPDCERLVTADADGQHVFTDIEKVIAKSEECPGTLVLGGRRFDENNVPFRSRAGNAVTRFVFRVATGLNVYDTQTGLRGFDRQCMEKFMNVEGDRYEYEMNMLLKAAEDVIPVHEVTIKTVYLEENKSSHFNALKDSFRIYKSILKFAASSFIAFLIEYVVFLVLHGFLAKEIANVIARAVSSMVNFYVNHEIVFKSKEKLWKAAIKYFSLVAVMLVFDTLVLKFFMEVCHIPGWLAKPMTMTLIFFLNYPIQRKFVYKRQDRQKNG